MSTFQTISHILEAIYNFLPIIAQIYLRGNKVIMDKLDHNIADGTFGKPR